MTPEEARLLLDATSLPDAAEPHDELQQQARVMMQNDPALAQWIANRRGFDERVAQALMEIPVPNGLRERILKEVAHKPAAGRRVPWTLVALASGLVVCIAWLGWRRPVDEDVSGWEKDSLKTVAKLDAAKMPLDHWSGDMKSIRSFLKESNAPEPAELPGNLAALKSFGCKIFKADVNGSDEDEGPFRYFGPA